jgi:hypothetical protein
MKGLLEKKGEDVNLTIADQPSTAVARKLHHETWASSRSLRPNR